MEYQVPTVDEAIEQVLCGCPGCLSVPVSTLQLEADIPIGGWEGMFEQLHIRLVTDHVGAERSLPLMLGGY